MNTIRFECLCGQRIEINTEAAGQVIGCPSCGDRIAIPHQHPSIAHPSLPHGFTERKERIVTVQKTSKQWKVVSLFGSLFLLFSIALGVLAANTSSFLLGVLTAILAVTSFVLLIIAKIGAWWDNG